MWGVLTPSRVAGLGSVTVLPLHVAEIAHRCLFSQPLLGWTLPRLGLLVLGLRVETDDIWSAAATTERRGSEGVSHQVWKQVWKPAHGWRHQAAVQCRYIGRAAERSKIFSGQGSERVIAASRDLLLEERHRAREVGGPPSAVCG